MIKIGTPVSYDGGKGIVDRTSMKTGVKLHRVNDKYSPRRSLPLARLKTLKPLVGKLPQG